MTSAAPATSTAPPADATGSALAEQGGSADCPPSLQPGQLTAPVRFNSLRMVSPRKGFAVDESAVLVTDDGRSWNRRYSGSDPLYSMDAVDADHAWAIGQRVVLATTDGGRTWLPLTEPAGATLRAVDFVDAQTGWGATGHHVVRTADGGHTWREADPPCGGEAVCFTGADDGWAAIGPRVYRTTDGGDSWKAAFTAPADDITRAFNRDSVHAAQMQCARSGIAWVTFIGSASGSRVGYVTYRGTADGQWTPVVKEAMAGPQTVQAPAGGTFPGPMSALGADSAVYVSFTPLAGPAGGLDLRTATDGGRRLGPARPIPGLFSAAAVSFLTPEVGWAIGAKSGSPAADAVEATADGGRTWEEQYSEPIPPPSGSE